MALSISGGNGSVTSQANTQTPQSSVGLATNAASAGRVQTGTASSLLSTSSNAGVNLAQQQLPTVTVGKTTTSTAKPTPVTPNQSNQHHNPALLGLALGLLILAAVFLWFTGHSAKNTTD